MQPEQMSEEEFAKYIKWLNAGLIEPNDADEAKICMAADKAIKLHRKFWKTQK